MRRCAVSAALIALGLAGSASAEILSARYSDPTTRYAHAVLGDDVEYGGLELRLSGGRTVKITLPTSRVFEDLEPRLADMTGDGTPEVITVESDSQLGARLAIYDENGLVAATPFIGTAFRWLAPVGAADLDGDGAMEVAYVDRPHLARTLRVWRFADGALSEVASKGGLTNHRIGEDFISGGIRDCGEGPEMITANAGWTEIMATTFDGTGLASRSLSPFSSEAVADAMACRS